ncbi:AMP-binding protein (plasmid) [Curtobacterium sp. MCLR17_007]|uniref:AMP-binding protein n=1 Tax=Curtobacterium sp. MCLR17_007 TaxID=2175648 RepID=UPI000DA8C702|nr:AMP-binding protein [Curtobacterium sp. MCLR17_007]WIB62093.1 AMP-binding protein [Curtobacterium sp. MCLR17_007]
MSSAGQPAARFAASTDRARFRGWTVRDVWAMQVSHRPTQPFLTVIDVDADTVTDTTYEQFDRWTNQIANLFLDRGVRAGDRVVVQQPNSAVFVGCLLAAAKIGAVLVPLAPSAVPRECVDTIERTTAQLIVTDGSLLTALTTDTDTDTAAIAASIPTLVTGTESHGELQAFAAAVAEQGERLRETQVVQESDLAEIMFTSGTTARPKGVMLSQANLVFAGEYVNWELGMHTQDRYLTAMMVTLANFQLSALMPVITAGSTLLLATRYSATRYWRQAREQRATLVQAMAMIARTMLLQPVDPDEQQHDVRHVHYFLPISDAEKTLFEERFHARLLNNYGSTETIAGTITDTVTDANWPSIGRIGPGYQAKIAGPDGTAVPTGETGEILIQGVPGLSLAAGYWQDPAATAAAFTADGWFRTGDYGSRDADGWFFFAGRAADRIKAGGQSISASEIETVLRQHPDVADAAVVGVDDPVRDATVVAFIVPEPGTALQTDDLRQFCSTRLAAFKIPTRIDVVADLPRGHYGKVRKDQLLARTRKAA